MRGRVCEPDGSRASKKCMFWEKDGCVGERGMSEGMHVRRMHIPTGLFDWDIVT